LLRPKNLRFLSRTNLIKNRWQQAEMTKIKNNIKFINEELIEEDSYLWRYIDLHKFLSFIFNKSLYFSRLDKFEDKNEGISLKQVYYQNLKRKMDNHPKFDDLRKIMSIDTLGPEMNKIEDDLRIIQRFNFANCWFLGNQNTESVAMWNLYSNPDSIAIKINYVDFKKTIIENGIENDDEESEIICSPIKYFDFQKTTDFIAHSTNLNDSVFQKDISFEHEKEYRLIIKEKTREIPEINYKPNMSRKGTELVYNSIFNYPGIELKLENFEKYNFEIIFHPKTQDWLKENIKKIVNLSNIKFKVSESKLELR